MKVGDSGEVAQESIRGQIRLCLDGVWGGGSGVTSSKPCCRGCSPEQWGNSGLRTLRLKRREGRGNGPGFPGSPGQGRACFAGYSCRVPRGKANLSQRAERVQVTGLPFTGLQAFR